MEKGEIADYFPEMRALKSACKFNNCLHVNEPKCAILKAVEEGQIAPSRYHTYLGIINGEELQTEF
jgi:ribosome biogenesis GTPase